MKDSIFEAINAAQQTARYCLDRYGADHPLTLKAQQVKADLVELYRAMKEEE